MHDMSQSQQVLVDCAISSAIQVDAPLVNFQGSVLGRGYYIFFVNSHPLDEVNTFKVNKLI
jgi:hypothetical protein